MSRNSDIVAILELLKHPSDAHSKNNSSIFGNVSDEELQEMKASLLWLSQQKQSSKWKETLERVNDLSDILPLLEKIERVSKHIETNGWLDA